MTTEARVYNKDVEFYFDPTITNTVVPEPDYDEELEAGIVPEGGIALLTTIDPETDSYDEHALIKDHGPYVNVTIGKHVTRSRKRDGTNNVRIKNKRESHR